ncbi:MAG: hypothetical protein GAK30_00294 [Paracidovorax wautersii]|uniref:AraC-type arabinose-binding/dimerisation domain-containing protein n=1 Tax=Paracidovorax wautersii TaxID=1177982 RepID=A0A7V8FRV4_9BURK|nr:MAG: hypothetical protein GAK30_00294 [Paracidovorax wautersii]
MTASTPLSAERRATVSQLLADVRGLIAGGITREALAGVARRLEQLAARPALFPASDFPTPDVHAGEGASTRYRLNPDDGDDGLALYLNAINPGKSTWPHNHTTWAVIVAIEGQELNRIYRRTDDGSDPAYARLEVEREVLVQPGSPLAFLPDDIHSIHVGGDRPTLHFHLYGQPLETLVARIGIHPETGEVVGYNRTQMSPSKNA